MYYKITAPGKIIKGKINLTPSKSESNRALIIQSLCRDKFEVKNLSPAQDTLTLQSILQNTGNQNTFDVGPAGTTMRFLTAYFSTIPGTWTLTGSERMKKRPIGVLVDALRQLGADIKYLGEEGFPPLEIHGKKLNGNQVLIDGKVSSQFVTALLLIAPQLTHGLTVRFINGVVSHPYINMTLKMMEQFGVYGQWTDEGISVSNQQYSTGERENPDFEVEADWSAASYWYSIAALSETCDLEITGLKQSSLQGDSIVANVFNFLGVNTEFTDSGIRITKVKLPADSLGFDFSECPDIAQTTAVAASALGVPCMMNGLHTLRLKETDRIRALASELKKFGVISEEPGPGILDLKPSVPFMGQCREILTYDDHRMAMSFAPLSMICEDGVIIENPESVKKSYPAFWEDLKSLGFGITEYSLPVQG